MLLVQVRLEAPMFNRRNLFKSLLALLIVPKDLPETPKKLKINWSFEAEQDLLALHNKSLETEITSLMAAEIQKEIDNEMINRMIRESKKMPI
jgi:hypothetical protein